MFKLTSKSITDLYDWEYLQYLLLYYLLIETTPITPTSYKQKLTKLFIIHLLQYLATQFVVSAQHPVNKLIYF